MTDEFVSSDFAIIDLLRAQGEMTVADLAEELCVTPTAVRQRLTRLLAQHCVERSTSKAARGRPSHHYRLTERGRRKGGANFADLAVALWEEVRAVKDPQVRQGLLGRLAQRMAMMYAGSLKGQTVAERMRSLAELFAERRIPFSVEERDGLPILTAEACPYPELAEKDRSVCAMERMMFSELFGSDIRLTQCRLDGSVGCTFTPN